MSEPVAALSEGLQSRHPRASARQTWAERLARFADSGLRPAQFCAKEGVSLPSFYAWRRRLSAAPGGAAAQADGHEAGPRLLPVRLPSAHAGVELLLPSGALLRLSPGCDLAFVRSLAEALGGVPC